MTQSPNAVELTVEAAWYLADLIGAGSYPWVLAITPPYLDANERAQFEVTQRDTLSRMDVLSADGTVSAVVAEWVRTVCYSDQWLELRYVGPTSARAKSNQSEPSESADLMRGVVARRGGHAVVALRNAQLVTFTAMAVDHPHALVPIVVAGLDGRRAASFPEFALPARVGARADEQLRSGAKVSEVVDFLGIAGPARSAVESVYTGPRSYVEIVAGARRHGRHATSEVGVGIIDAAAGRILVSPHRAVDGEWVSTFAPATHQAIAVAIERLTATLPDGPWFPDVQLTREFTTQTS